MGFLSVICSVGTQLPNITCHNLVEDSIVNMVTGKKFYLLIVEVS